MLEQNDYEVILCAGDDLPDESMFDLNVPRMLTIKVGSGPTRLPSFLEGKRSKTLAKHQRKRLLGIYRE
jgi:trehalose-6-phosphatase